MAEKIIEIKHLSKSFGDKSVLKDSQDLRVHAVAVYRPGNELFMPVSLTLGVLYNIGIL